MTCGETQVTTFVAGAQPVCSSTDITFLLQDERNG